jgi:uncharacterized protein YggE
MKSILNTTALLLFGALHLSAQADGNFNSGMMQSQDNVSAVGNMSPVLNFCSGNATTLTTGTVNVNGFSSGQSREYYNPYTGKYETTPGGGGNEKANAALPYDNTVVFDADIMINIKASSYTAIFSMTDFGKTVYAADSALAARVNTFLKGLKKDSVRDADVHIDFISMLPIYEVLPENKVFSNIATEKPAGFKIKKNVHVLFYDHRKLDHIITDAAAAGIYDLVKVDYNVNDIGAAYDTLRKVAVSIIDMKRQTYEKMGFLTTILTMAEGYDSKYPEERYASYTAYIQGVSAQNVAQQNPNVQVREAEKEQTIFYNKVPYKQFDKVLNADLAEPGVQFYYKLRVKCKMEPIPLNVLNTTGQPAAKTTTGGTAPKPAGSYKPPVQPARKP